ncbi:MAG: hypothetical protein ACFFCS_18365 [Candidatus Hodarchaeota archaeon]
MVEENPENPDLDEPDNAEKDEGEESGEDVESVDEIDETEDKESASEPKGEKEEDADSSDDIDESDDDEPASEPEGKKEEDAESNDDVDETEDDELTSEPEGEKEDDANSIDDIDESEDDEPTSESEGDKGEEVEASNDVDEGEGDESIFESEGDLEEIMSAMQEVEDEEELAEPGEAQEGDEIEEIIIDREPYLNIDMDVEITQDDLGADTEFLASLAELKKEAVIEDRLAFTMARSSFLNRDIGHEESYDESVFEFEGDLEEIMDAMQEVEEENDALVEQAKAAIESGMSLEDMEISDELAQKIQEQMEKKEAEADKFFVTEDDFIEKNQNALSKIWYHALYHIVFKTEDGKATKRGLYESLKDVVSKSPIDPMPEHMFQFGLSALVKVMLYDKPVCTFEGGDFLLQVDKKKMQELMVKIGRPLSRRPVITKKEEKKMFTDFFDGDELF